MTEIEYRRLSAPVDLIDTRAKLSPERRNAAEAMSLYMHLADVLIESIAERDRNAYRRTLRAYRRTASRVERRYKAVQPTPALKLGNLHRAPSMPRPMANTPQQRAA